MHFNTLPQQVAAHLRSEINDGRWKQFLPSERNLAAILNVSRRTIVAAINLLRREKILQSEPARGHRIMIRKVHRRARQHTVGLLMPLPLDEMRPGAVDWMNQLRLSLNESGCQLTFFHGAKYISRHPDRALDRLVRTKPQSCWLLAGMNAVAQVWFARHEIPAIVAGTSHPDAGLSGVDVDYYALGRHAANRVGTKGHRHIAVFLTQERGYYASELECERGLREVLESSYGGSKRLMVYYHDRTRDKLLRALHRAFAQRDTPTALIMSNSLDYLTAVGFLGQLGKKIPQDVSLLARNDDAFMRALTPEPTRYHASSHAIARNTLRLLQQVIEGSSRHELRLRIMPDFIAGESLGAVARPSR